MNTRILLPLLIIICLSFSCKKEKSNNQGTVEFDVDGLHHSFIPEVASIGNDDPLYPYHKYFQIISPQTEYFYLRIIITDDSNLTSNYFRPITYPSPNCGCDFRVLYSDTFRCQYDPQGDTAAFLSLEVTSSTETPSVINGTFEAKYSYGQWDTSCYHEKRITNGKITSVILARIP
jgi:hypothetical protein